MTALAKEIWNGRHLLGAIVRYDLKASLITSRVGFLWWFVDPALLILIYWVFIVILLGRGAYAPYPLFIGCALFPWRYFVRCVGNGASILRSRRTLIRSAKFSTIVLPLSVTLTQFTLFAAAIVTLAIISAFVGSPPTVYLIQLPALMVLLFLFVAGISMLAAGLGVIFRDLSLYLPHLLRMGFLLSPALYGVDRVEKAFENQPWVIDVYNLNPFVGIFSGFRSCIWDPQWVEPGIWITLAIETAVVLVAGIVAFKVMAHRSLKHAH